MNHFKDIWENTWILLIAYQQNIYIFDIHIYYAYFMYISLMLLNSPYDDLSLDKKA